MYRLLRNQDRPRARIEMRAALFRGKFFLCEIVPKAASLRLSSQSDDAMKIFLGHAGNSREVPVAYQTKSKTNTLLPCDFKFVKSSEILSMFDCQKVCGNGHEHIAQLGFVPSEVDYLPA